MRRCESPCYCTTMSDIYSGVGLQTDKLMTRLRLKIYRSLGIDVEPDEAGNFTKAVIRNSRKGDVHVVNIDPKFSRFFYSNYFWSTMQG